MATLEQIYDFEGSVEEAARAALKADKGITARMAREKGQLPNQMIGARLLLGTPLERYHEMESGRYVESQFQATLTFFVRTYRESDDAAYVSPLHADLRSKIRVFMLDAAALINAQMSLHEIASEWIPQANNIEYSNETYDITELPYQISIGIKDDAWPA